jgi:hypothetical protein
VKAVVFPSRVEDITPELLTAVLAQQRPGIKVKGFDIVEVKQFGEGIVSTADRVFINLDYVHGCQSDLPERVVIKTMLMSPHAPDAMYLNEVRFYQRIRPFLDIETPQSYGSAFDEQTGQFGVILEDLSVRGARFPNATTPISLSAITYLVKTLASLHAQFWASPRFETDLNWLSTPCSGGMSEVFKRTGFDYLGRRMAKDEFKGELVSPLHSNIEALWSKLWKVQELLEQEPTTLLHGDPHIGNIYLLPGDKAGLLDWQLMIRGSWAHDVTYLLVTGLDIEARRKHEREFIKLYLAELKGNGVTSAPDFESAWEMYRRAVIWGLVIGWLITPPINYGQQITTANIKRLVAAAQDLETLEAIGN